MSKPASVTEFGTLVPGAAPAVSPCGRGRFADVKTYAAGRMPEVKVGQIFEDLDPRCRGRRIQVLKVGGDGRVLVRTIAPRTCKPRTAAKSRRDTTGAISWIALRRFRENSRGFRLVKGAPLRSVQSCLLGARLAAACDIALSERETRAADALIGLLGNRLAHEYLDLFDGDENVLPALYLRGGVGNLLADALTFAGEIEVDADWDATMVADRSTVRRIAQFA